MSDIYVDYEMLESVRKNLSKIGQLLDKPSKAMKDMDTKSVGVSELESRMDKFCDEWSYGIGQIKKASGNAVDALKKFEKSYDEVDTKLAEASSEKGKPNDSP